MDKQPAKVPRQYFSPLQIGSIAEATPLFPIEAGVVGAFAAIRAGQKVVLVAQNRKALGLISCSTLEKIIGKTASMVHSRLPDLTAYLIPPLDIVEASVPIDAVMARYLEGEAGDGAGWFVILHKESYLGVVGLRTIIEYINTLRVRDLIQAGEIQRNLLDKSKVDDARFQVLLYNKMAHELGGDFYRVFRRDKDRYVVGCFDVAGKNISGSLATMALGACFSALDILKFWGGREETTRFVNTLVRDVCPPGLFVTAVLFYVDFGAMTVTIHNCGFSPVLIFAPRGKQAAGPPVVSYTVIQPNLPPLGIRKALGVGSAQMVPIRAGLRLTAYSDGLTDMANSRRERYGEKKTFELLKKFHCLPQKDLRKLLEKEIADWIGAAPETQAASSLADDVTLVDMRFL